MEARLGQLAAAREVLQRGDAAFPNGGKVQKASPRDLDWAALRVPKTCLHVAQAVILSVWANLEARAGEAARARQLHQLAYTADPDHMPNLLKWAQLEAKTGDGTKAGAPPVSLFPLWKPASADKADPGDRKTDGQRQTAWLPLLLSPLQALQLFRLASERDPHNALVRHGYAQMLYR